VAKEEREEEAVTGSVDSRTCSNDIPKVADRIRIRPLESIDEYWAVERLQREVWGLEDIEIVPDHMLITAHKNGGLLLGAFETAGDGTEQIIGFVFGIVGLTQDGGVKHCSHMAGVSRAYQSQNVGYRLKLAQRERVLSQEIDLITWTFDPLESRNARLNFRKLGAICKTYLRDLYGDMRDTLNAGLPSDRFQVEWHIASAHVAERLSGSWRGPPLSALQAVGVPVLNQVRPGSSDLPEPSQHVLPLGGEQVLVQIPARFQAIKSQDLGLALAWREHTRDLIEEAFRSGYVVVDLLFEEGQSTYLLQKEWKL
jgi:predicted GNAT superfamily acetyltransferase